MRSKLIGSGAFYRQTLALAFPIMVQTGITNLVNTLDNIMVGQVGTVQMNGTAIANQLLFVFNLCIFGAVSGAGIFGAQYAGSGDHRGLRDTLRFKLMFCVGLSVMFIAVLAGFAEPLINLFLRGKGDPALAAGSLHYAKQYLFVMLIGLIPYAVAQCYASTLRETGKTVPPMTAGLVAVAVNLILNYLLIFGRLGMPRLGVVGAAVATIISRFAELAVVAVWTHRHYRENRFVIGLYRRMRVPLKLVRQIAISGLPLMLNETAWSLGITVLNQRFSTRGIDVVSAQNIQSAFFNVFAVAFMSVGVAIGIMVGQQLGAGETDEAKDTARRLTAFSVFVSAVIGAIYFVAAEWIPLAYNTTPAIRHLATRLMQISAICMPIDAFAHASYFTLRSGGRTHITIVFDSGFMWGFSVPLAFLLTLCTPITILPLFAVIQVSNIFKDVIGFILVKRGRWIRKIID